MIVRMVRRPERVVSWYEHDGSLDWSCSGCRACGTSVFTSMVTAGENPTHDDYEEILTKIEVEHAAETGCKGRILFEIASRHRFMKHERLR